MVGFLFNTAPKMALVMIPLPSRDFDPSEVAVSWSILKESGHSVVFATPDGLVSSADPLMLTGEGLDAWGFMPLLRKVKVLGLMLRANFAARSAYAQLRVSPEFRTPLRYEQLDVAAFDGLLLPGGHWARGMKSYLESAVLQAFVGAFFDAGKPVGAICHGVVLAARSRLPSTGKSALYGRKTTALTWKLEGSAWTAMRYVGRFWDPGYYRTYLEAKDEPRGYWSVQAEVERALAHPTDFQDVAAAGGFSFRKTSGLFRDSSRDSRAAFVVQDGQYLSARWPGDVHTFARQFSAMVQSSVTSRQSRAC